MLHVLKRNVFIWGGGGGGEGWRTRPPLSEFSGSAPDETFLIITRSVKSYSTKMVNVFFHRDLGANLLREIPNGVFQYLEDLKVL